MPNVPPVLSLLFLVGCTTDPAYLANDGIELSAFCPLRADTISAHSTLTDRGPASYQIEPSTVGAINNVDTPLVVQADLSQLRTVLFDLHEDSLPDLEGMLESTGRADDFRAQTPVFPGCDAEGVHGPATLTFGVNGADTTVEGALTVFNQSASFISDDGTAEMEFYPPNDGVLLTPAMLRAPDWTWIDGTY